MLKESRQPARRYWTLRLISLGVALMGCYNLLLAADHTLRAGEYRALGIAYPPLLRAGLALLWGIGLLGLAGGLWRRRRWARRWVLIALSNYGAFSVLWLIVFARSDFAQARAPFQAVLAALAVAATAWAMRWRRVRTAFEPPGQGG